MAQTLTSTAICARALRIIGAFPITETAPEAEDLREAMFWLDMIMAEVGGTNEMMFLVPDPVTLTLVAGTQEYDLESVLGAELPDDGIQSPIMAWVEDADGNRFDCEIVSREKFYSHGDSDATGTPEEVYINRIPAPVLKTWPTLDAAETNTYYVKLVVQRFTPNVSPSGVSGATPASTYAHEFRTAWNRFLTYRLAADIGSGPVRFLPQQRISHFHEQANKAFDKLDAVENREHDDEPPVAEAWGA